MAFVRLALVSAIVLGLAGCDGDDATNLPPTPTDDLVTVEEDAPIAVDVLANDTDPEGKPLRLVSAYAAGHTVTVEGARVHVATEPNWNGSIDVRYVVSDGELAVDGHALVTVTPVNDAPNAHADSVSTGRNEPKLVHLEGADIDGDALTFEVVTSPAHGTLSGTAPDLTYTPAHAYTGVDTFVFHARDAALPSLDATIQITVLPGAAPVATAQTVTTLEDTSKAITLAATDHDLDPLTFTVTQQPAHGTLSGTAPALTYAPAANYHGPDSFKFVANDGVLTSNPATVTVNVTAQNDAPVAQAQTVTATEDQAVVFTLAGSDVDGDAITYNVVGAPARGSLTGTGATLSYQPAPNLNGSDTFTFTVSDGTATSAPATVTINVAAVEDAPVATAQSVSATEDTARSILIAGSDGDGDSLTFSIASGPAHGTITGTAPALTYTPAANYNGADSFTFAVNDGDQTSAAVTVSIAVAAVDDVPVIAGAALSGNEGEYIAIPLPTNDIDGETLTYTVSTFPAKGSIFGSGAALTYNSLNTNGNVSFALTASDGHSSSTPATFTVAVTPVADAPLARDDIGIATPNQSLRLSVLANDYEFDGETMSVQSVSTPLHGTIVLDGDDVIYTTTTGNTASDMFTYVVTDTTGLTATATVYVGIGEFPTGMPLRFVDNAIDAGTSTFNQFLQQDISRDGRYIVYTTRFPVTPGDTNQANDVYLYDRMTTARERISVPTGIGGLADGPSERPSISADGRYVAFASAATNLVANDTNGTVDVFVRDRVAGTTKRVSVSSTGTQVSGTSRDPEISADGSVVAFSSNAFELVPNDANGVADVFVRDLIAETTTRVSVRADGGEADLVSVLPVLSDDGNVIAFVSAATNLVSGDTNGKADVFVYVRSTKITERVSVSSTGVEANGASTGRPALSADGRFVAFMASATNLVPGSTIGTYVRDRQALTTISAGQSATNVSLSGDGRYLVGHTSTGQGFVRDRFAALSQTLSNDAVWFPVISTNGRYIVLLSSADLDSQSHSSGTKVYVYANPL